MADDQQLAPSEDTPAPRGWLNMPRALAGALIRRLAGLRNLATGKGRLIASVGLGLFLLISAAATVWYVQSQRDGAKVNGLTLDMALEKLDAGERREARRLASELQSPGALPYDDRGGPAFIHGAAIAYDADESWDEPRLAEFYLLAAKHLEQAREQGFPPGREGQGLLTLARSWQFAGRYAQSIPVCLELMETGPAMAMESQHLLAAAYLYKLPPDPDKAQEYCDAYLANPPYSPQTRQLGLRLAAEIALANDDREKCSALLGQVSDVSLRAGALVLQGRVLLAEAAAHNQVKSSTDGEADPQQALYRQAIDTFRQASAAAPHDLTTAPQAAYFIGVALRKLGELPAAQRQFSNTAKLHFDTPAGLLASLEAAEVLLELGRLEEAVAAYDRTIQSAGPPAQFTNRWISADVLRERIEQGYATILAGNRYGLAIKLSRAMPPLFENDRALELRAKAHHQWAKQLAHEAEQDTTGEARQRLSLARRHYRQAGVDFARLAHLHYTQRRYPEDLWQSGQNFNLGRDYKSAIVVLREFLSTEARPQRPLAMAAMGEALLSLNETDEAIAVLEDCLREFPKDPGSYHARLLASQAYVEKGEADRAARLLLDNLHQESLTPRSDAWRDSLFALGKVLHDQGLNALRKHDLQPGVGVSAAGGGGHLDAGYETLQTAVRRLGEAVARYPDDPRTAMALYLMAESDRHSAQLPLVKLESESIESRRLALSRQAREHLTGALDSYDGVVAKFNSRTDPTPLSPQEELILRNAYFARGTTLYELGLYEEAVAAYSTATSRYQHEPAAVEAYVQIAACFRRLNKPAEARGTLEQAKLVIDRIRPEADFTTTTRFDRDEWKNLLNWMSTL